jgi:hypothetical protein
MQQVTHLHTYRETPSLEALPASTLKGFLREIPESPTPAQLLERAQIETELALHPDLTREEHLRYQKLRIATDEELGTANLDISRVSHCVGYVFLPIVLRLGDTPEKRNEEMYRRAGALLDVCEDNFRKLPRLALGVASELLFDLSMRAVPSLTREDRGFTFEGEKLCWDALLTQRMKGGKSLRYKVQIKHDNPSASYHSDIVVVQANPVDLFRVKKRLFVDFVRLALPGSPSKHAEMDKFEGRVYTFRNALAAHGPSRLKAATARCMLDQAA